MLFRSVRRFVLLHKQLDADDQEVTRTKKVRRSTINARYGEIVGALFGTGEEVALKSVVTYQDGSQAEREISLRIASMNGSAGSVQHLEGAGR